MIQTTTRRLRRAIGVLALVAGMLAALAVLAPSLGLIDSQALRIFGSSSENPEFAAVFVSGDMGLRFGMGPKVARALASQGVPVLGVSSPVNFGTHRSRAEVDAIVARSVRTALARTGAKRIILMGQSFGADIISTAAPDLPAALRRQVAAIVLVVPGQTAYFRSDPIGLSYHGTPDARPAAAMRNLRWAPTLCVYGVEEPDSLCPQIAGPTVKAVGLPGGHFLHHDDRLLTATIMRALRLINRSI